MPSFEQLIRQRKHLVLGGLLLFGLLLAWLHRFVQDDAFISFHYARNLIEGKGLTWFGTRIEGYTNFLWVMWIALGLKTGVNAIAWSYVGSLTAFVLAVISLWNLALLIFKQYFPAFLSVLLFLANFSVISFATGGLETMAQTALLLAAVLLLYRSVNSTRLSRLAPLSMSLLLAAAVMTRPDSALPGAAIGIASLWMLRRKHASWSAYAMLAGPAAVILFAWLCWKWSYYNGELLPNTFYAKLGGAQGMHLNGLIYIGRFMHWYGLWPFFALGAGIMAVRRIRIPAALLFPILLIVLWLAYLIRVGGDFMEFRFIIPITPYLTILLAYAIHQVIGSLTRHAEALSIVAFGLLLLIANVYAARFSGVSEDRTIDSISALGSCYDLYPNGNWQRISTHLGHDLAGTGATIALRPVGAIPYYTRLGTIDMWGLNDATVARHGVPSPDEYRRPGHRRHASLTYLREKNVNLVIGHPRTIRTGTLNAYEEDIGLLKIFSSIIGFASIHEQPPERITLVTMPINPGEALLMWYMIPTAAIDQAIQQNGWETRKLRIRVVAGDSSTAKGAKGHKNR